MTVYVLQMCDWEDQSIISIHSSQEAAEEARTTWCMEQSRGGSSYTNFDYYMNICEVNSHEVIQ